MLPESLLFPVVGEWQQQLLVLEVTVVAIEARRCVVLGYLDRLEAGKHGSQNKKSFVSTAARNRLLRLKSRQH